MEAEANALHHKLLIEFLQQPINNGGSILSLFAALPGAIVGEGTQPLERYVYVPGSRKNRLLLVAHVDTLWDENYSRSYCAPITLLEKDGIFYGSETQCGIGADDRAGCAMLWALRNSGHSLLVVDGEEHGKIGAKFLRRSAAKLFREINGHRFIIECDWVGNGTCLFSQVYNTKRFRQYIFHSLGYTDAQRKSGTDLQVLCRYICGVNVGIGYHNQHTAKEYLDLAEWEHTLTQLKAFLEKEHPRFCVKVSAPLHRLCFLFRAKCNGLKIRLSRRLCRKHPPA